MTTYDSHCQRLNCNISQTNVIQIFKPDIERPVCDSTWEIDKKKFSFSIKLTLNRIILIEPNLSTSLRSLHESFIFNFSLKTRTIKSQLTGQLSLSQLNLINSSPPLGQ